MANRENSVATKVFRFIFHFLHICLLDFRPHPPGRLLIYFVVLAGPLVSIVFPSFFLVFKSGCWSYVDLVL